jgi:hypothetical protein
LWTSVGCRGLLSVFLFGYSPGSPKERSQEVAGTQANHHMVYRGLCMPLDIQLHTWNEISGPVVVELAKMLRVGRRRVDNRDWITEGRGKEGEAPGRPESAGRWRVGSCWQRKSRGQAREGGAAIHLRKRTDLSLISTIRPYDPGTSSESGVFQVVNRCVRSGSGAQA